MTAMPSSQRKIVLTFGCLSGLLSAAMMYAVLPFLDQIGFDRAAFVGYTAIVISFLFVFFGVRAYRDRLNGAPLTFGRAFGVGLMITLISCVFYVVAWQVMYHYFLPDFIDQYSAHVLEKLRASGAAQAVIDAQTQEMAYFKDLYANPIVAIALTFIEPFPVGLLVTLISAVTLRTRGRKAAPAAR